jgi:hypothetical protein
MVKEGVVNLNFFFFAELANWFKIATGRRAGGLAVGSTQVIVSWAATKSRSSSLAVTNSWRTTTGTKGTGWVEGRGVWRAFLRRAAVLFFRSLAERLFV